MDSRWANIRCPNCRKVMRLRRAEIEDGQELLCSYCHEELEVFVDDDEEEDGEEEEEGDARRGTDPQPVRQTNAADESIALRTDPLPPTLAAEFEGEAPGYSPGQHLSWGLNRYLYYCLYMRSEKMAHVATRLGMHRSTVSRWTQRWSFINNRFDVLCEPIRATAADPFWAATVREQQTQLGWSYYCGHCGQVIHSWEQVCVHLRRIWPVAEQPV